MEGYYIALFICIFSLLSVTVQYLHTKHLQRTIDRQQDTIHRLINREPVTYTETGQTPQKDERFVYAAWGNQMVNIDEDERQ